MTGLPSQQPSQILAESRVEPTQTQTDSVEITELDPKRNHQGPPKDTRALKGKLTQARRPRGVKLEKGPPPKAFYSRDKLLS